MILTLAMLDDICANPGEHRARKVSFIQTLSNSSELGVAQPPELALMLSQVCHESARFRFVRELWGPTSAQRRYEGRKDLGNIQPGDGKRFMGRDLIQVTGRANYRALSSWARTNINSKVPDFENTPERLEDPEWLGLGVLWFWAERVPEAYKLSGDVEKVSISVNGGRNGIEDRYRLYARAALALLGYRADDIRGFQLRQGLTPDGISGPLTRKALHKSLAGLITKTSLPLVPISTPTPMQNILGVIPRMILSLVSFFRSPKT